MCVRAQSLSCIRLLTTLWTVALQAPLSRGFSRQEYWSGLSFPSPGLFLKNIFKKFILFYFIFLNFILFLNLKHCISFAKHQNESATGIHV